MDAKTFYEGLAEHLEHAKTLDELKASGYYLTEHPYAQRRFKVTLPKGEGWYKTDTESDAVAFMRVMDRADEKRASSGLV